MGSVLLIGGAGFIGSHIAERLVEQGKNVTVVDNWRRGKREWLPQGVNTLRWDVRRPIQIPMATELELESVVNLACLWLKECAVHPEDSYETNMIGTLNAYLLARAGSIPLFVQFSSASVYGETRTLPMPEGIAKDPTTNYGMDKLLAEQFLRTMNYGPQVTILRPYNVYGRRQAENAAFTQVLPIWARAVSEGKPIVVYGDGTQAMDMIHVTDVARFVTDYALAGKVTDNAYNVASGVETSASELAETCRRAWGVPGTTISFQPYPEACPRQQRRWADITRAKATGWRPEVELEDGLADYWEWFRKEAK